jgi:uncharacterized iron-regulated membrane protein
MKLSAHAFTRFWDVHAWVGVIGGLVLYVMFLTGAITLFHQELEVWQEPLAQQARLPGTHQALFERAFAKLPARLESVWFYPKDRCGAARIHGSEDGLVAQAVVRRAHGRADSSA